MKKADGGKGRQEEGEKADSLSAPLALSSLSLPLSEHSHFFLGMFPFAGPHPVGR